ncbi:hypothetical protein ANCCEY_04171 [Ancylostoma ceylanicum]|uniref:Phosphatidylinositol 4-kinase type 2 n=1 Tax=Ancylostoma ceylanicum TaxID=53326 RepID=A0A0D6LXC8_9BILA|nr:hypothetical protein ANCCEY_04171 [Ancylostoma ceylanicum]
MARGMADVRKRQQRSHVRMPAYGHNSVHNSNVLGHSVRNSGRVMKDKGFDKKMFERQLSVMRGQIFNLREALRTKKSPYQLILMPAQYMVEVKQKKRRQRFRSENDERTDYECRDFA